MEEDARWIGVPEAAAGAAVSVAACVCGGLCLLSVAACVCCLDRPHPVLLITLTQVRLTFDSSNSAD